MVFIKYIRTYYCMKFISKKFVGDKIKARDPIRSIRGMTANQLGNLYVYLTLFSWKEFFLIFYSTTFGFKLSDLPLKRHWNSNWFLKTYWNSSFSQTLILLGIWRNIIYFSFFKLFGTQGIQHIFLTYCLQYTNSFSLLASLGFEAHIQI